MAPGDPTNRLRQFHALPSQLWRTSGTFSNLPLTRRVLSFCVLALTFSLTARASGIGSPLPENLLNLSINGIYDHPVLLQGGVYEGAPFVPDGASRPRVELLQESHRVADINGDGSEDSWVLLSENSGGSGERLYLAAVVASADRMKNVGTLLLGDRIKIMSIQADGDRLRLDYVAAGPGEPACCPTLMQTSVYGFDGDQLIEWSNHKRGSLSTESLAGSQWRLIGFGRKDMLPSDINITVNFEDTRIYGTSGCNSYTGAITGSDPYDFAVSELLSTRRACPQKTMQIEFAFLDALSKANQFGFMMASLYLSNPTAEGEARLFFERQ